MRNSLVLSLLITGVAIAMCYIVVGLPMFETNDDTWMAAISSGVGVVDRPDEHILWSNFLVGLALKSLNTIAPGFPWYGTYLLVLDFIAIATLHFLLLTKFKKNSTATKVVVVTMFVLAVCIRCIMMVQFTTTSILLGIAASVLMFASLDDSDSYKEIPRFKLKCWILSAVFLIVASLVRERAVYMLGVVSAIAVTSRYLFTAQWRKLLQGFIWVAMLLAIAFGVSFSNDLYYSRDEWREFYPLNRLYIPLMQYNRFVHNGADVRAFAEAGLTQVDMQILKKWYVLDRDKFTMEKFRTIRKEMDLIPRLELADQTASFLDSFRRAIPYPVLLAIFVLLAVNNKRPLVVCNATLIVGVLGLFAWLLFFMKLPQYILNAILFYAFFIMLWHTPGESIDQLTKGINTRRTAAALVAFGVLLVSPMVLYYRDLVRQYDYAKLLYKNALKILHPRPDDLYVDWGGSLPLVVVRPFDDIRTYFKDFKIVRIASFGRSPQVENRLKHWGITDLICQLDNEHLYTISLDGEYFEEPMKAYVAQSCRKKLSFSNVEDFKALNFRICKARYKELE